MCVGNEFPDSGKSSSGEKMPFSAMSVSETMWAGCFLRCPITVQAQVIPGMLYVLKSEIQEQP